MKSIYSHNLKLEIFGASHAPEIGMSLSGIPAGIQIDIASLHNFLMRRAPGTGEFVSGRREPDTVEFKSGFLEDFVTNGETITAIIKNVDARPADYEGMRNIPRPGHADYTTFVKYGEDARLSGGGHSSGRMSAPLCIAGGICLQILEKQGVTIESKIDSIGGESDEIKRIKLLNEAREDNNSLGGIISLKVTGLRAGLGDPMFYGMENRISNMMFAIPAVKGVEFGKGFELAAMTGFEANDEFAISGKQIITETNNCGGILGGITDGMPLTCRVAFKPTPSIARLQKSVNLRTMEPAALRVEGRHDACIVLRARPIVEAAGAIAIFDAVLEGCEGCREENFSQENEFDTSGPQEINFSKRLNALKNPSLSGQDTSSLQDQNLDSLRAEIDSLDEELIKLFERRMDVAKKIGDYKKSNNLKIEDEAREKEKLKSVKKASRPDLKKYTKNLYKTIFELSKKYQKK